VFCENQTYINQIKKTAALKIDWKRLKDKTFFIAGASGLIGTVLIDILMFISARHNLNIKVCAIGRNKETAKARFYDYWDGNNFLFIKHDVNKPIDADVQCDYVIHAASNTHPAAYSGDPIGTIETNVTGLKNILEFAAKQNNSPSKQDNPRVMFLSSVEIYGENRGDTDKFDENYCGYINCNALRAGYPESKRLGEAMCQAYIKAKGLDIVIPRLSRVYGPSMSDGDSKAIAQFIKKAVSKEDIVLKSEGVQLYSYTYAADAASALLFILLYGKSGEAYNVSDENSEIALKDLAETLAGIAGTKVTFEIPDEAESLGYSKATKAVLDNTKLKALGWNSEYAIKIGLEQTVEILKAI